jgi:hypothetical protein
LQETSVKKAKKVRPLSPPSGALRRIGAVATTIKCVDEKESDIMWWTEADERPDKIGQYRMITKLKIVPDLVQESQMFRVEGWEIALVISETVKVALEKRGVAGIRFE